jgi:inner membrane protein
MNDSPLFVPAVPIKVQTRSLGVKLIVVCVLALVMGIPAQFVDSLVSERTARAKEVTDEIAGYAGGKQTFLGPTLAIPYQIPAQNKNDQPQSGIYLVFPAEADATATLAAEERHRSLFKVPVYKANLKMDAAFDLTGVPASAPENAVLDWSRAEIVVGATDARGAATVATLSSGTATTELAPAASSSTMAFGSDDSKRVYLSLFGTNVSLLAKPGTRFHVSAQMSFTGSQRIALLAYGKSTHFTLQGNWPAPGFDGGFLPVTRNLASSSFSAEWSVPFIARGVPAEAPAHLINKLEATSLGVSLIEVADPYQSVSRSLKYALLFMGLVFLSYFVFEVTTGRRVHPAQYILVGVAQIIFYLLLLSLAERIGFDWGFLIAGLATVLLLAANAAWIFVSRLQGLRAFGVFALLYALIYLLLRLEDNALLVGALASFLIVAAVMYFTRRIDWYSSLTPGSAPVTNDKPDKRE